MHNLSLTLARPRVLRQVMAISLGALVVALSAQFVVPVPFSPVPMTLQPLAVLVVGALLGPTAGTAALVTYLAMGIAGLPVFAAGGAGVAWLLGPTGGYLLAFPLAAAVAGWAAGDADRRSLAAIGRLVGGFGLAVIVIHIGGLAQLALLGGDPATAFRIGLVPFVSGDLLKVGLAALLVLLVGHRLRSLR